MKLTRERLGEIKGGVLGQREHATYTAVTSVNTWGSLAAWLMLGGALSDRGKRPGPPVAIAIGIIGIIGAKQYSLSVASQAAAKRDAEHREVHKLEFEHALRKLKVGTGTRDQVQEAFGKALMCGVSVAALREIAEEFEFDPEEGV